MIDKRADDLRCGAEPGAASGANVGAGAGAGTFGHARLVTRRDALRLAGGAAAAAFALPAATLGLAGCASSETAATTKGFASDCEVWTSPVTIRIVADDRLQRAYAASNGVGRLEEYITRYQSQTGRGDTTIAVKYYSESDLNRMIEQGFTEGDAVVTLSEMVVAGCEAGMIDGGAGRLSVREFISQLTEKPVVVRASGSSAEMPAASTINGDDSPDGSVSRMQNLPSFDGKIGIVDESYMDGWLSNRALAYWGLYSDSTGKGGAYSSDIADKMVVFDSPTALASGVRTGACDIAFASLSMTWGGFGSLEKIYEPSHAMQTYSGSALPNTEMAGAARDFFQFIMYCS